MRGEPLSVDEELVALCFATKDRVIVDDEAASALGFLEEDRGGEAADTAPDSDEVVHLAGVARGGDLLFECAPPSRSACPAIRTSQVLPFECR